MTALLSYLPMFSGGALLIGALALTAAPRAAGKAADSYSAGHFLAAGETALLIAALLALALKGDNAEWLILPFAALPSMACAKHALARAGFARDEAKEPPR